MSKKMSKKFSISDLYKGFYKLTHENGIFEYITPAKLEKLQQDKTNIIVKFSEEKIEDNKKSGTDDLEKLKKADLIELAKRLAWDGEEEKITKAQLIEYITENDK